MVYSLFFENNSYFYPLNILKNTEKMKIAHLFLMMLITIYSIAGETSNSKTFKITITPDHSDWRYEPGEDVVFSIYVEKEGKPATDIEMSYQFGPEMQKPFVEKKVVLVNGKYNVQAGTLKIPGFLRLTVKLSANEKENVEEICTVAFQPEKIKPTVKKPTDFEKFWEDAIVANQLIPLTPYFKLQEDQCTDKVNVYQVSFQNYRLNSRMYGWLAVPKKEGKYPAIIQLPGAGVWKKKADTYTASRGFITLNMFIHGIPLDMPDSIYDILKASALSQYYLYGIDNVDRYYYKRVITGCVRAVDFIYKLPEFDGINLGVTGQSQGGALSIITASLDKRVKAVVAFHPALCDQTGYLNERAGGWPGIFKNYTGMSADEIEMKKKVTGYYDVVNFAGNITQTVYLSGGYNDLVCPPTSYYCAYNSIKSPKSIHIFKETGHWVYPQQQSQAQEWLIGMLQKP